MRNRLGRDGRLLADQGRTRDDSQGAEMVEINPGTQVAQRIEGIGLSFDSVDAPVPLKPGDQHDGAVAHTTFEIEEPYVGLERSTGLETPVGRREVQEGQAKVLAREEHQGLEAARLDGELRRVRLEDKSAARVRTRRREM